MSYTITDPAEIANEFKKYMSDKTTDQLIVAFAQASADLHPESAKFADAIQLELTHRQAA